jgi:tetratricopeptide (TPR) repeat protein
MLDAGDLDALARTLVGLGQAVERQDHMHGALEIYSCAYAVATAIAHPRAAAEAAWYSGRLLRRRAAWDEAAEKYRAAQGISEIAGLSDISVHVLVGLAVMKQDLGNLPAARLGLEEALSAAEALGDRDCVAVVHHSYMGLEQAVGDLTKGLEHGWVAVATYESDDRRTQCMAGLAGALLAYGDWSASEDAWTLVAHTSRDRYYLIYAHDALSHLAALRGDEQGFALHASSCDALGWETGTSSVKAEILYYRGLSYRALGRLESAEEWLRRAIAFTEEHRYNRVLFEAEAALDSLAAYRSSSNPDPAPAAPAELRIGLRTMRQELVGLGTQGMSQPAI